MRVICKPYKGWVCPLWHCPPVLTRSHLHFPSVLLSELEAGKKQQVWAHIQSNYTPIAELLKSDEFQQFKRDLETHFGPVAIGVDLKDIGGTLHGVCRTA
nr:hypothetical protein [Vibrio sp. Y2-5]